MSITNQSLMFVSQAETLLDIIFALACILTIFLVGALVAICFAVYSSSSSKKANTEDEINNSSEEISNIVAAARDELDQMSKEFLAEIENRMSKTGE